MITQMKLMRPGEPDRIIPVDLPEQPGYTRLQAVIEPLLASRMEHVTVMADFGGGTKYQRADMFVDEIGHVRADGPLPRNESATAIYRTNALLREPGRNPESMPWIAGPAILFDRRVWF